MQKAKRISLGEGEGRDATGQMKKHILESKKEMEYQMNSTSIDFMLKDLGVLTHDEHAKMVFEAGKYRSYNQVEWNPFSQEAQRVFD